MSQWRRWLQLHPHILASKSKCRSFAHFHRCVDWTLLAKQRDESWVSAVTSAVLYTAAPLSAIGWPYTLFYLRLPHSTQRSTSFRKSGLRRVRRLPSVPQGACPLNWGGYSYFGDAATCVSILHQSDQQARARQGKTGPDGEGRGKEGSRGFEKYWGM